MWKEKMFEEYAAIIIEDKSRRNASLTGSLVN